MQAGRLDRLIEIRQMAVFRGPAGGEDIAWPLLAKTWAMVTDTGGSESFEDPQRVSKTRKQFRCRWLSGVTAAMRVVYAGQTFRILTIAEGKGRGKELVIEAELMDSTSQPGGST